MENIKLIFSASPWYILLSILVGLFYAWALYQKKSNWSKQINLSLAFLRFVVATIICLLLFLNPLLRQITTKIEKPTVVFAIDNSQSIAATTPQEQLKKLLIFLQKVSKTLQNEEVEIDIQYFDNQTTPETWAKIPFTYPQTNLSDLLTNIRNNYENQNLDKVILVSDGIYNQGLSPAYLQYQVPVFTLALGDPTPKKDLKLQAVLANKIAYLGNRFPVVADIENIGYPNKTVTAYLSQNGRILDKKTVTFQNTGDIEQVTFYTEASQKGMQHYVVSVDILEGEFSTQNNSRDVYVEVIDGQEKILIIAATPHPDIKALRTVIEKNDNYKFYLHIPNLNKLPQEKFDLVIFHQVPNVLGKGNNLVAELKKKGTPIWFILGGQTDVNSFNQLNNTLKISGRSGQLDEVQAVLEGSFDKFIIDKELTQVILPELPPLTVIFGEYAVGNSAEVLFKQKVGNITTEKPLLILNQNNQEHIAILAGEGIWHWRLEEFALHKEQDLVDEIILKTIQFLTTKEDKRKLRVYPVANEFYDFEKVIFETEIYNDLYEKIYGPKVSLKISTTGSPIKSYNFTPSAGNSRFEISELPKGVYQYTATATIKGKTETASGEFTVRNLQLEALNYTADHNLLKQVAKNTKGEFFLPNETEKLQKRILETKKPNLLHSTEDLKELLNLKWIFFLLVGLATLEWATRKYQGSY